MSNDFVNGFKFLGDNTHKVLEATYTHLEISGEAVAIALVIALPLGIWLGHIHRFSFIAINLSNLGRALPSLAILAILIPVFGIGRVDVLIALVVLAFPPMLTNTYVAIDQVDAETVDAAKGIGLTPLQVLFRVELPMALPLIFAGIRTSAVFVVATATLGGFFGGGGLGDFINNIESYHIEGVIGASYVVIVLAFLVQILFLGLEYAVTPAGIRQSRGSNRSRAARATGTADVAAEAGTGGDGTADAAPDNNELAAVGNQKRE